MTATLDELDQDEPPGPDLDLDARSVGGGQPPPERPSARPVPAPLVPWRDPRPWVGWAIAAGLMLLAGFTRFWSLGFPNTRIFDEAYYPVEAQEILRYGYEDNRGFLFIVHPPLGKWLIGWSTALFGNHLSSAFGWRVAPAIFGCLTVLVVARTARRMFRSNLFGGIAGALMCFEGLSLVLARTAILDVFLQFFVFAAFASLVRDREQMRARLGALIADGADLGAGVPSLGPRPWRLLAGVLIGLAGAVKWTALSFYLIFFVMSLLWDRGAYKVAGARRPARATGRRSVGPAIASLLIAPLGAYLLTYTGWFAGENGWARHYADTADPSTHLRILGLSIPWTWAWVPAPIRSLGWQTYEAYQFHEGLDSPHSYGSNPWSWWVLGRPVDFYYDAPSGVCGSSSCSREVLLIGTPLLWWAFIPMMIWLAWHYVTTRDWRAGVVWAAFLAGWLVWFQDLKRTMFLFYMAPLVPFLVLGLTLALGVMLGPALRRTGDRYRDRRAVSRRQWGMAGVTVFLGLVVVDFVWMWPIFTGALRTYDQWHAHMWLPSWV